MTLLSHAAAAVHHAFPAHLLLSAIVDSSDDAILSQSVDGTVTSWNAGATRMFGYRPEDIVGHSVVALVPPELVDEHHELMRRLQQQERIDHYETVRCRRDGQRVPVSLTFSALRDEAGMLLGASSICRDITFLKQSAAEAALLAAIVESSDDAIISKDLSGTVTSWNRGAERVFGYTADEMIGEPVAKLFPADRLDEEPRILERLRRGERVDHYQTIRVRKNGEHFPVSLTISPIADPRGRIVGASKVARDITKEVEAVRQLARANEELKRADRMKSEFIAMMSHELRTPLNSIIGFASVLRSGRSGSLTPDQSHQIGLIRTSGKHLLHLINDLLDLSRMEAGKLELELEDVAVGGVLTEAVETLKPQAAQKRLELRLELGPTPRIRTDRARLLQVLLNVLGNAVKFTPRGHVAAAVEADGTGVIVRVRDTGIGIPADKLGTLFQPFMQVEGSARRRFEGTGLGLYLSRKLLGLLGGTIDVESAVDQGSCFTLRLPAATPDAGDTASAPEGARAANQGLWP